MECGKCNSSVDARSQSFVVCEGECSKCYHVDCVGLTEAHTECIAINNILWMCDLCLDRFYKTRSAPLDKPQPECSTPVESELAGIKSQINDIMNTLSVLMSKSLVNVTLDSPTPISSTKLIDGNNEEFENNSNPEESCLKASDLEKETFALFLTNVDSYVTEREIEEMVRKSIRLTTDEKITVFKLVPKWIDIDSIDYASFKIVLNARWKTISLNSSTWPSGIKFREFVSLRGRAWRPNYQCCNR